MRILNVRSLTVLALVSRAYGSKLADTTNSSRDAVSSSADLGDYIAAGLGLEKVETALLPYIGFRMTLTNSQPALLHDIVRSPQTQRSGSAPY